MNTTQEVFVVFYAILWGTAANAQPRWKAFQFPLLFRHKKINYRIFLSMFLFNILPIIYFGWTLWMLSGTQLDINEWDIRSISLLILHAIIPAFATFGFHRMWIGIVEIKPELFYFSTDMEVPQQFQEVEPSIKKLGIKTGVGFYNILYAFLYIIIGLICSQILR